MQAIKLIIIVLLYCGVIYGFCGDGQPLECSVPWFVEFFESSLIQYKSIFESACVEHDYCYRHGYCTFSEDRKSCDEEFLDDMKQICRARNSILSVNYWKCIRNAEIYYSGVRLFGQPYFLVNQSCSICHYKNISIQSTLASNETQSKLLSMFDPTLYSTLYFSENENTDSTALFENYLQEGIKIGRIPSLIFDPKFYLMRYSDLKQEIGFASFEKALLHFLEEGQLEGRQGSMIFDPEWYLNNASALLTQANISESTIQSIYGEYLSNGILNGRAGSEIFDPIFYLQKYTDVAQNSRNESSKSYHEAAVHFIKQGLEEGRQGSAQFSATQYLDQNQDLKSALANTTNPYYMAVVHYFAHGRYENRRV